MLSKAEFFSTLEDPLATDGTLAERGELEGGATGTAPLGTIIVTWNTM